jgi:hypothetical protein
MRRKTAGNAARDGRYGPPHAVDWTPEMQTAGGANRQRLSVFPPVGSGMVSQPPRSLNHNPAGEGLVLCLTI